MLPVRDFGLDPVLADLSKNASILSKPQMLECRQRWRDYGRSLQL